MFSCAPVQFAPPVTRFQQGGVFPFSAQLGIAVSVVVPQIVTCSITAHCGFPAASSAIDPVQSREA